MTHPLAESLAERTPLTWGVCPVVKELYGYAKPVLDEAATLQTFCETYSKKTGYYPHPSEQDAALAVIRGRADQRS